jgi:hypothetical protein
MDDETRVLDPTAAAGAAVGAAEYAVKVLSPKVEKFSDWLMPDEKNHEEEESLVRCRQCSRFVPIQVSCSTSL